MNVKYSNVDPETAELRYAETQLFVEGDDSEIHVCFIALIKEIGEYFSVEDLQEKMKIPLSAPLINRILKYMQQEGLVSQLSGELWRFE